MPEAHYTWLPRAEILDFEEVARLARVFAGLGVEKIRLTGGEPLLRRGIENLIGMLKEIEGISEIALTTNGILLGSTAASLRTAGLDRLTVSLDTLEPGRFQTLTQQDKLSQALAGIDAALDAGFPPPKIDTVLIRGTNDDEIESLLAFSFAKDLELRFIEYMDVGGATQWAWPKVVPQTEILDRVAKRFGPITPQPKTDSAPACRFILENGKVFGIIASTTQPFCGGCDRSRLTADGKWFLCLYALGGLDLRQPLRGGQTEEELRTLIAESWEARENRGAEDRKKARTRGPLAGPNALRDNPHLEMHTRGG
jgi:cyclic pyranopterin phosphate synthase